MKKSFLIALCVVLCTITMFGCTNIPDLAVEEETNPPQLTGGITDEGINLKNINIQTEDNTTKIVMSFISGSRVSGVSEAKVSALPVYDVSTLSSPSRLRVDLNVDFWDYEDTANIPTESIVLGVFNTIYSHKGNISVYFQLKNDVEATLNESGDKLEITLKNVNATTQEQYFAGINAFEEYEQDLIDKELKFTPTLCNGLNAKMLISAPFESEESAKAFCDNANELIAGKVPTKQAFVFKMQTNQLPEHNREVSTQNVSEKKVMMVDDVNLNLPVLVENGKYLTTTADGNIIYARAYLPNYYQDNEQVVKERLWVIEQSGRKTELPLPDFYSVEKCEASTDGRYLAILDSAVHNKVLYVYDNTENKLYNMGEEGFGAITASFDWAQDKNIIYAMSGGGTVQLKQYDFSKGDGERISSVEEKKGALGKIEYFEGNIYFVDSTAGEGGEIYKVDIATHQRETVTEGIDFRLSKDGKNMAVISQKAGDEEQVTLDLNMLNLETAEESLVAKDVLIEDFSFDANSDTLYYMTPNYENVNPDYPFALMQYSLSAKNTDAVGYCATGRFNTSKTSKELYIIDYYSQANSNFYITYIYDVK